MSYDLNQSGQGINQGVHPGVIANQIVGSKGANSGRDDSQLSLPFQHLWDELSRLQSKVDHGHDLILDAIDYLQEEGFRQHEPLIREVDSIKALNAKFPKGQAQNFLIELKKLPVKDKEVSTLSLI